MQIIFKAYVYLTCGSKLLVFDEPDHPDVGLQVPGGTLDPGESFLLGAKREFREETGLDLDVAFTPFFEQDFTTNGEADLEGSNGQLAGCHRRRMFHATLPAIPREEWEHFEMTPSIGGDPIRFRLFWIDLFSEQCQEPGAFHVDFDVPLATLRKRVSEIL